LGSFCHFPGHKLIQAILNGAIGPTEYPGDYVKYHHHHDEGQGGYRYYDNHIHSRNTLSQILQPAYPQSGKLLSEEQKQSQATDCSEAPDAGTEDARR